MRSISCCATNNRRLRKSTVEISRFEPLDPPKHFLQHADAMSLLEASNAFQGKNNPVRKLLTYLITLPFT